MGGDGGQAHDELAAVAGAVAAHRDAAAVQLHQLAHQRQADSKAAAGLGGRAVDLREQVENAVQHLRLDADAVVRDRQHHLALLAGGGQLDTPAFVGVLAGVVE